MSKAVHIIPPKEWTGDVHLWRGKMNTFRLEKDADVLGLIFNERASAPELDAALTWGESRGLEYVVDYKCHGINGYYAHGTGVVALSARKLQRFYVDGHLSPRMLLRMVGTLTHEIAHARQDYHGLLETKTDSNLMDRIIRKGLIEADASARGALARFQHQLSGLLPDDWTTADNDRYKIKAFRLWYEDRAPSYAGRVTHNAAQEWHVPGVTGKNRGYEFQSVFAPPSSGIDPGRREDILLLGKGFSSGNYIAQADESFWDFLGKKALSREAARVFFRDDSERSPQEDISRSLLEEVLKRQKTLYFHKKR